MCYGILAPISIVSELLIFYGFIRIKELRKHPEIMIFWQCCSQLILDLHWFTGIEVLKAKLSDSVCQFLGAFCMYFYYLSWDYTLLLSIEILQKILNPYNTGYKKRRIWYQVISHLTSLVVFIVLMTGDNNGNSIMLTCFVENRSVYELFVLIPGLLHFPLCIGITGYTFWISYNTFYVSYLKYQMLVVVSFAIGWIPIAIVHGINYKNFHVDIPFWLLFVFDRQIAVLLGGSSGFLVFLARMRQKGLLQSIYRSIVSRSRTEFKVNLR